MRWLEGIMNGQSKVPKSFFTIGHRNAHHHSDNSDPSVCVLFLPFAEQYVLSLRELSADTVRRCLGKKWLSPGIVSQLPVPTAVHSYLVHRRREVEPAMTGAHLAPRPTEDVQFSFPIWSRGPDGQRTLVAGTPRRDTFNQHQGSRCTGCNFLWKFGRFRDFYQGTGDWWKYKLKLLGHFLKQKSNISDIFYCTIQTKFSYQTFTD